MFYRGVDQDFVGVETLVFHGLIHCFDVVWMNDLIVS